MARTFKASFPGHCSFCLADFVEGDEIGYNEDDEIICDECIMEDEAELTEGVEGWKEFLDG
jgi:hypothetical protein